MAKKPALTDAQKLAIAGDLCRKNGLFYKVLGAKGFRLMRDTGGTPSWVGDRKDPTGLYYLVKRAIRSTAKGATA